MTAPEDTGARQGLAATLAHAMHVKWCDLGTCSYSTDEYAAAEHLAAAVLAWVLGVLEDEGTLDAVYDAGDAAHDTQRHIHASECCWPPPNAAPAALAAVARVLTERAS